MKTIVAPSMIIPMMIAIPGICFGSERKHHGDHEHDSQHNHAHDHGHGHGHGHSPTDTTEVENTEHFFVLGVDFQTGSYAKSTESKTGLDHLDPMFGWGMIRRWEAGITLRTSILMSIGPNRGFMPGYRGEMEIHLGDNKPWIALEIEGHIEKGSHNHHDDEADDGEHPEEESDLHIPPPNVLISAGMEFEPIHVGAGIDIFHSEQNHELGHGMGLAVVLAGQWKQLHIHGSCSFGGSLQAGGFMSRCTVHLTVFIN